MSFDSILSSGTRDVERQGSVSGLEQAAFTILAAAGARVYHTKLSANDNQWNYSQWKGTLSLCRDIDTVDSGGTSDTEKHWFRLADDQTGRTVWMFKFPENFDYAVDRPFFHVFQGRTRRYGFLFNDDDEASMFGQKVMNQIYNGRPPRKAKWTRSGRNRSSQSRSLSRAGSISLKSISSPSVNSFKHIAHVGVSQDGVFEATKDLDDSWKSMLASLQGYGVSEGPLNTAADLEKLDAASKVEMPYKMNAISAF